MCVLQEGCAFARQLQAMSASARAYLCSSKMYRASMVLMISGCYLQAICRCEVGLRLAG